MDQYKIVSLDDNGNGYAIFYWGSGGNSGQMLQNVPVDDKVALEDAIAALMESAKTRLSAPVKSIDTEVAAMIGQRTDTPTRTR